MAGESGSWPHEEGETWGLAVVLADDYKEVGDYKELERVLIDQFDPPANILGGWNRREPIPDLELYETIVIR